MSVLTQIAAALDPAKLMQQAGFEPDDWQQEVLRTDDPRVLLLCCRQSGKSTVAAALAVHTAITKPNALVLLLSPSLRQSAELFRMVANVYKRTARQSVPLKQESGLRLELANGSRLIALPGTEETTRGFSGVDLLVIDEASRCSDELYYSVRPMVAVSKGRILALSTPWGRKGWFYHAWTHESAWLKIRIPASKRPRLSEEILEQERESLGETFYRQEYGCEFVDASGEGFVYADWCEACAVLDKKADRAFPIDIGLDVARSTGGDKTAFALVQDGVVIDLKASRQPDLMTTCGKAVSIIEQTKARSIRIDDSGLGGGVTDRLKELHSQARHGSTLRNCRIIPFNFGRRAAYPKKFVDVRSEMWWGLGELLRKGELRIPRNPGLVEQLTAPSMLMDSSGRMRLESKDSMRRRGISSPDLADALALACYAHGRLSRRVIAAAVS